jgi:hypothetical protein
MAACIYLMPMIPGSVVKITLPAASKNEQFKALDN